MPTQRNQQYWIIGSNLLAVGVLFEPQINIITCTPKSLNIHLAKTNNLWQFYCLQLIHVSDCEKNSLLLYALKQHQYHTVYSRKCRSDMLQVQYAHSIYLYINHTFIKKTINYRSRESKILHSILGWPDKSNILFLRLGKKNMPQDNFFFNCLRVSITRFHAVKLQLN